MATLALGAAGAAIGGSVLPGISVLGATLSGAALGQAAGAVAGAILDETLFAPSGQLRSVQGARLSDLKVSASTEGAPIPRVYGRARLPGQLIWATHFEEEVVTTTQSAGSGGKGLGGGGARSQQQTVTRVEYRYYANVAYAVGEGEITRVGRIWADGKELDQAQFTIRAHRGTEDQAPDSLIEAKQGVGLAPAYRGTAYVVLERMPLARFGNRLPQLNFEVFRAVDSFEDTVRAITIIPGAGEFVYATDEVLRDAGGGVSVSENVHTAQGGADWTVAIDQLQESLPNVAATTLMVAWFGNDLRASQCTLRPGVEIAAKTTHPTTWSVAGVGRGAAHVVSTYAGRPAFGGTPSDASVVAAIQNLQSRGYAVTFCPLVLLDIAAGNGLNDPYTGGADQPAYPWRGRMTVDPAPGQPGSPDQDPSAAVQLAAFVGTAQAGDFTLSGADVVYSGPVEWSLRRMVLHYAHLCAAAGVVDTFLLGTELRGLTQVRDGVGAYSFVSALVDLADDVKSVLGAQTKVTYAADWSEYFGHQPQDGTGDVYFNLDPLWSSSSIDAVAIDIYWPLADWRDGETHLDRQAGARSIYDLAYLKANIIGGEGFDWYYASPSDRVDQIRTPITDSGSGKPWVFRYKDIKSWWGNQHFNRPGGVEAASPTAWVPESKPVWFTELGCPAVDKGANQPNVFIDPKSAESASPYFSRRVRDDLMQQRYIRALHEFFDPGHPDYADGSNPASALYGAPMIDPARMHVYTWDARPYPAFPLSRDIWADGGNWEFGHWLNGRVAGGPLAAVVAAILQDFGFTRYSSAGLNGHLDGYVLDRIMSARQALQMLELAFFFDSFESSGLIQFAHRGASGVVATIEPDDLVEVSASQDLFTLTRGQETELPASAKLTYFDGNADYRQAAVEARRIAVESSRVATADLPVVLGQYQAQAIAECWLQDAWSARELGKLTLPPSKLALEPTDVIDLDSGGRFVTLRITGCRDGSAKAIDARSIAPDAFAPLRTPARITAPAAPAVFGQAIGLFVDLPLLRGDEAAHAGYVAAYQSPWPGAVAFYRSPEDTGFVLNALATGPASLGITTSDLYTGPTERYDLSNRLRVRMDNGQLASISELALLAGGNLAAVENDVGAWEVIQFQSAELIAPRTYELRTLLRGQSGTESAMRSPVVAGARFLMLDSALTQVDMTTADIALAHNWKYGPSARGIADTSYRDATHAFEGLGLRPLSPTHLRGRREHGSGDWSFSWIRRTRIGGDSWASVEVPLGEDQELYDLEILDGEGGALRSKRVAAPAYLYSSDAQVEDFGAVQWNVRIRVFQVSPVLGRGVPGEQLTWHF